MPDAYPDDYQPDPWLDLADDIRRTAAGAGQAEARVAGLEFDLERHRDALRDLLAATTAMVDRWEPDSEGADRRMWEAACGTLAEAREVLGTEIVAVRTAALADTLDLEQAEVWQARAEKAEARVAELEETIDDAVLLLAGGAPSLAARKLRAALARPPGEPDHA